MRAVASHWLLVGRQSVVVAKNLDELHARKGDTYVFLDERGQRRARQLAEFTKTNGEGSMKRSTDCGLRHLPDASLAFAKLYALAEGRALGKPGIMVLERRFSLLKHAR